MLGIEHYSIFILSCVLLNITPGSDTLYILGRTLSQGRRAGAVSVLGIVTGAFIHTLSAACGLSILLANSAIAFNLVKWLGAGYLIYLGVRSLLAKRGDMASPDRQEGTTLLRKIYLQGFLTNLLNPKVALFYLAFLPQFITFHNAFGAAPFLILGLTFITTGTIWCMILVAASNFMAGKLKRGKLAPYLNKAMGGIFILLGLNLLRARA